MLMVLCPATATSWLWYPIDEKMSEASSITRMEYFPSASVLPPSRVPAIWIVTNGTGSPVSASVTTPVTVTFCASDDAVAIRTANTVKKSLILFIG